MTVLDLITEELAEIGAYAQGEVPSAADAQFALSKLNRMIDSWNAQRLFVYDLTFQQFTLVPGLAPHTIGPVGATFTVAKRPVRIEAANIVLNNVAPAVLSPLNIRDDGWWQNQRVPNVTTTLPTDLYYSPTFPNGSLYFWAVPSVAYGVQLWLWEILVEYTSLVTTISLPQGYRSALVYSLAEELCPSFGKVLSPSLAMLAAKSREIVKSPNSMSPNISTMDAGLPDANYSSLPSFNWRVGSSGY